MRAALGPLSDCRGRTLTRRCQTFKIRTFLAVSIIHISLSKSILLASASKYCTRNHSEMIRALTLFLSLAVIGLVNGTHLTEEINIQLSKSKPLKMDQIGTSLVDLERFHGLPSRTSSSQPTNFKYRSQSIQPLVSSIQHRRSCPSPPKDRRK
jgi:hypothetical protein